MTNLQGDYSSSIRLSCWKIFQMSVNSQFTPTFRSQCLHIPDPSLQPMKKKFNARDSQILTSVSSYYLHQWRKKEYLVQGAK